MHHASRICTTVPFPEVHTDGGFIDETGHSDSEISMKFDSSPLHERL